MAFSFADLPLDCVYGVTKYLEPRDRLVYEPVSRRFAQAIRLVWDRQRTIRVEAETPLIRSHFFSCNNPDHSVRQCDTISRTYYSDKNIVRLLNRCRNLIAFEWNAIGSVPRDILAFLINSKKLEHIHSAASFQERKTFQAALKCLLFDGHFADIELTDSIETVCYTGEMYHYIESIRSQLIKLPNLKKLIFNFTGDQMDEDDNTIYTQLCTEQDCIFEEIEVLPKLESVSLSLCSHFSYLETMPNLTELVIHSDSLDSSFPEHVKLFGREIKSVQITGYSRKYLSNLFENAPNIEKLSIDDNLINEVIKYNLKNLRLIEVMVHSPQPTLLTPLIRTLLENSSKLRTIIIPTPKRCKNNIYANVLMNEVAQYAIRYPKRQINAIIGAVTTIDLPANINYQMYRVNYKALRL